MCAISEILSLTLTLTPTLTPTLTLTLALTLPRISGRHIRNLVQVGDKD